MNPELYERYLAKKAKKLGISIEELKAQSEEQRAGGQEGRPLTVESGKLKVESLSSHAPSLDGEGWDGVISIDNNKQLTETSSFPSGEGVRRTEGVNSEEQRTGVQEGRLEKEVWRSGGLEAWQFNNNDVDKISQQPQIVIPPSPQPSPSRGEGACYDSSSILQPFNFQPDKNSSPDTVLSSSTSPHPNPPHPGRERDFSQNSFSTFQPFNHSTNNSHTSTPPYLHTSSNALSPLIKDNRENKFALIGYPLGHSLSKVIHEAGFKSMGVNATYDILETPPDTLVDRIKFLKNNGYKGFNVTIPLKLPVSLFVNEVDRYADLARAINTVYIREDKTLVGYNTDVIGFKNAIPSDIDLRGKHVGILGTGGASHASCVALSECGVSAIDFFTRSIPNSIELMNYVRRIFPSITFNVYQIENIRNLSEYDMLVNTTPIGMLGKSGDMTPVEEYALKTLKQDAVVYDVIYNPKKTVFIKLAEKLGLRTITGLDMLIHQAVSAQKIWLGGVPDFKDMKISALEAL